MKNNSLPQINNRKIKVPSSIPQYKCLFQQNLPQQTQAIYKLLNQQRISPSKKRSSDQKIAHQYIKAYCKVPPNQNNVLTQRKLNKKKFSFQTKKESLNYMSFEDSKKIMQSVHERDQDIQSQIQSNGKFRNQNTLQQYPLFMHYLYKKIETVPIKRKSQPNGDNNYVDYYKLAQLPQQSFINQKFIQKQYKKKFFSRGTLNQGIEQFDTKYIDNDLKCNHKKRIQSVMKLKHIDKDYITKLNKITKLIQAGRNIVRRRK